MPKAPVKPLTAPKPSAKAPASGKLAVIIVGTVLGLLVLGGIAALIYFAVVKPAGVFNSPNSDSGILQVGDRVYMQGDLMDDASYGPVWLHLEANKAYFTTDMTNATVLEIVATPKLQDEYVPSTGDNVMLQSYGVKDFGNGEKIDAVGKITLRVPDTDIYMGDSLISTSCTYSGKSQSASTIDHSVGLALIDENAENPDADYQWVATYGNPPTNSEIDAGTTGSNVPSMGFAKYGVSYKVRPSYTLTPGTSSNFCGGHPWKIKGQTDNSGGKPAESSIVLGWSNDSIVDYSTVSFIKAN